MTTGRSPQSGSLGARGCRLARVDVGNAPRAAGPQPTVCHQFWRRRQRRGWVITEPCYIQCDRQRRRRGLWHCGEPEQTMLQYCSREPGHRPSARFHLCVGRAIDGRPYTSANLGSRSAQERLDAGRVAGDSGAGDQQMLQQKALGQPKHGRADLLGHGARG